MSITVALLVTDAQKDSVTATVNDLTPEYTIGFIRKVAPIDPVPTPSTPATHWYTNGQSVPDAVVSAWQAAIPDLEGLIMFTATNADNALGWAVSNLESQGLMFVPDPEI